MMENSIAIQNLSKSYKDFQLDNISFNLPEGHIMGLVGPNGSGKTTLIKVLMNIVMKDSGTVEIFGKDPQHHEEIIKRQIGFVSDQPDHYCHLTLKELKNMISPFYETWDEAEFQRLIRKFNLPLNKLIKKLSKGKQVQGAIVLALSHHARLLVMDEPTAGLDPIIRRELLDFLRISMEDEKLSILFSTHITSDIERVSDYITLISNGKLIFSETKDDLMQRHALIKGDKDLLDADTEKYFLGIRRNDYGFEALTDQIEEVEKIFEGKIIKDKVSLEDIMYYNELIDKR